MSFYRKMIGVTATGMLAGAGLLAGAGGAQAATPVGIEYEHDNYGGWSYTVTASDGFVCDSDFDGWDARKSTVPASRDNRITSYKAYAGCWAKHFDGQYSGGVSTPWGPSTGQIDAAMNDRTSSIEWT